MIRSQFWWRRKPWLLTKFFFPWVCLICGGLSLRVRLGEAVGIFLAGAGRLKLFSGIEAW